MQPVAKILKVQLATELELLALCELLMALDPSPLTEDGDALVKGLADKIAKQLGFENWLDAYHGIRRAWENRLAQQFGVAMAQKIYESMRG